MLREASAYFVGKGRLRSALRQLVERLNAEEILYALLAAALFNLRHDTQEPHPLRESVLQ